MEINYEKWNAGWLQWGYDINCITDQTLIELNELKAKHPDWDFNQLKEDVRNDKLKPR
jgi:hypothetical protein